MHHSCQLKKNVYRKVEEWVEYQATPEEIGGYQSIIGTLMWVACQCLKADRIFDSVKALARRLVKEARKSCLLKPSRAFRL